MNAKTDATFWDAHWQQYELPRRVDLRSYFSYRCDRLFRSVVPRTTEGRFIDVGSGLGQWLIYFHEEFGYEVVGVDSSPAACNLARRNLDLAGVDAEILCSDILTAPLEQASFDVVYSGGLVEHFDDPMPIVERISGLVKPGGIHIVSVPNLSSLYWLIRRRLNPAVESEHRKITPDMLRLMLERSGMADVTVRYFGSFRLPYVRRRGEPGPGLDVSPPLWLAMRSVDRGLTTLFTVLDIHPEATRLSQQIVAIGRGKEGHLTP